MKEEKKKMSKYYNPYPFLVKVLNDLKQPQTLAPQAHCKVKGGEYDQSPLELIPVDKRGERIYKKGLGIELRRLPEEDLVNLAWAVQVSDNREALKAHPIKDLIMAIKVNTGDTQVEDEDAQKEEAVKEQVEEKETPVEVEQKEDEAIIEITEEKREVLFPKNDEAPMVDIQEEQEASQEEGEEGKLNLPIDEEIPKKEPKKKDHQQPKMSTSSKRKKLNL